MYKLKAVLAISLLISLLTGSVYFFAGGATNLPNEIIESEHSRVQDILREKLLNAEASLHAQAHDLAADPKLVQELGLVRTKLMASTAEELRKNESNRWPEAVYNSLINWKQKQDSTLKQYESTRSELMKAPEGSMMTQRPAANWWKKSPDLLLAFAAVPMKDGVISSLLIAHGISTKKVNPAAGKRYDEVQPILAEVTQTQKPKFGHFVWDQKMYMAVVSPVMQENNLIGIVVSGLELSASMNEAYARSLPTYVNLMMAYSSPKFGDEANNPNRILYTNASADVRNAFESGSFHVMSHQNTDNWISYDKASANAVYATQNDVERPIAFSRVRWTWNENEETDLYVVTNLLAANKSRDELRTKILIAGLIALVLGAGLAVVMVNMMQRNMLRIRKGFADAIATGEPIAPEALALLTGEDPDDLGPYTIQPVKDSAEESPEEWSNLMMDFDDAANHKADADATPEEATKLKESADIEEAKPLYEEYMRLRKENNIDTPMDFDCFLRRLQRNAAKIKATYKCDNVTFHVHVSDGNVVLKPKIEKKKSA